MRFLLPLLLLASAKVHAFHVIIDPGHGGADRGARQNGLEEARLSFQVALMLAHRLGADPEFRVSLTRTSDVSTPLTARSLKAVEQKGDLFISLHLNSSLDPRTHGPEFYIQNQMPSDEESLFLASRENGSSASGQKNRPTSNVDTIVEDLKRSHHLYSSALLAKEMQKSWIGSVKRKSPRMLQAPFYVLSEVPMPSTLLELGYLSCPEESAWYAKEENQRTVAEALYRAIKRYKQKVDKTATARL